MADLTAADLSRIVIYRPARGPAMTAAYCSNVAFARWVYAQTGEFTRFDIAYPETARVMWANIVNRKHPVEMLPVRAVEDD